MLELVITPKHECSSAKIKYNCEYILSIQDFNDEPTATPEGVKNHLHLFFDDLVFPEETRQSNRGTTIRAHPPTKDHVATALNFARTIPDDARLLVHCFAGVSRSSAIAYAIYALIMGRGHEREALDKTAASAPYGGIYPNPLIVEYTAELIRNPEIRTAYVEKYENFLLLLKTHHDKQSQGLIIKKD